MTEFKKTFNVSLMKKTTHLKYKVPESYLKKWQHTVNLMADIFNVPAGLIMGVSEKEIEVLVASKTENNPYRPNERADLGTGLYCETVMSTRSQLCIKNALEDYEWKNNPDVKLNMIFYLGVPLIRPDAIVFGTICVLDDKRRSFSKPYQDLLWQFKETIETDFQLMAQAEKLHEHQNHLEELIEEHTIALKQEISGRKQKEKELVQLEAAIEQAGESIVITDRNGDIQYVNPCFEHLTGYSAEETKGINPRVLQSGRQDQAFYQTMWESISSGQVWKGHITNKKKNGNLFEEEATIAPVFDNNQEIINYVAVKRDVTEKIKTQKLLQQSQKMEAIGTMAGGIAHDFNNMLSVILGNADMALDVIPDGNRGKYYVNQIIQASRRVKDLVKQILTFSRQTDQKLIPSKLSLIIEESLKLLRSTTPTTVSIVQDICKDCDVVMADSIQIHQLLLNLCSNAIYAMDEKGIFEVSGTTVDLEGKDVIHQPGMKPGKYFRLTVSDTGAGISKKIQERIFDPFYTTKGVDEGTGMGLPIVLGVVKSHGGFIQVDSRQGEGATFTLFFPTIKNTPAMGIGDLSEEDPQEVGRILFVDDEEMLAVVGGRMLERLGYKMTVKSSSNDALETFISNPDAFDLVITDQTMPNMSGAELSIELLKIRPDIPIILCTGYSKKISKEEAKRLGIRKYLTKPLDRRELAKNVREVLT